MSYNIAVIGKSGQLAWELARENSENNLKFFGRDDIDITCSKSIELVLGNLELDAVINASAYTAVDLAETDKEDAYKVNAEAVDKLVTYCKSRSIHFTHISTDYVFDGEKRTPYLPEDSYGPKSVYGDSKKKGEEHINSTYPENSCIIRTSWVYSSHGKNFVKTMLALMKDKGILKVVNDQIGSPTSANSLAKVALCVSRSKLRGIHHWTDGSKLSWYEFAKEIYTAARDLGTLENEVEIQPVPSDFYPTVAKRPLYSVLDIKSMKDFIGSSFVNDHKSNLRDVVKAIQNQSN